mgnify:CR=1 FL=1
MKLPNPLRFLNLLDGQGNLSITNTAVYVLIAKIATAPSLDWPTAATLLVTLMNYAHKRTSVQAPTEPMEVPPQLQEAADQVKKIAEQVGKVF